MSASKLDAVYRSLLITKFFTKGWGKPDNLRRLFEFRKVVSNREECFKLIEPDYPVTITKDETLSDCRLLEGYFLSPLERFLPGIVPEVAQKAHFQVLLPNHWSQPGCKPVCLHFAGTGDHHFWRRRNLMVKPLLKEAGIGGIILENPFYGLRKPVDQVRSSLHNVSDIFVMGGCLILEALVLFHWCERHGLGPLGVTGLSMGGHMASLAATNWPKPLVLVPCLSWATASAVFLQGVMAQSINWDLLEDQYLSDGAYREKLSKMVTIVDEAFLAGKRFAQTYSGSVASVPSERTGRMFSVGRADKKVDITYKESTSANITDATAVNMSDNVLEVSADVTPPGDDKPQESIETIRAELKTLLEEGKISQSLYDKLMGGEKFELHGEEIDALNSLTNQRFREILRRIRAESTASANKVADHQEKVDQVKDITSDAHAYSNTLRKRQESEAIANTSNSKQPKSQPEAEELTLSPVTKSTELVQKDKKLDKKPWHISDLITTEYWSGLRWTAAGRKIDIRSIHWRDREALQFMRGIMDECTHLSNFSVPYDTELIIAVCAKHDAYVPRDDVGTLEEIWPGAEVRYVDAGHVTAYILHQSLFRSSIIEAFERSKKKWKDGKHIN